MHCSGDLLAIATGNSARRSRRGKRIGNHRGELAGSVGGNVFTASMRLGNSVGIQSTHTIGAVRHCLQRNTATCQRAREKAE